MPGPAREASLSPATPVEIRFTPDRVKPGQSYSVVIPDYAGHTIDLAFEIRFRRVPYSDVFRKWCTLDASGRATLMTPEDHPAGSIAVRKIRSQQGPWAPARGSIQVVR